MIYNIITICLLTMLPSQCVLFRLEHAIQITTEDNHEYTFRCEDASDVLSWVVKQHVNNRI